MARPTSPDAFSEAVRDLRARYEEKRKRTNLFSPGGPQVMEADSERRDGIRIETFWRNDGTPQGQCVRLVDRPGTLSGDILRLLRDVPPLPGHAEIDGDSIRELAVAPPWPTEPEDDSEDLTEALAPLPVVTPDPAQHFVKQGKYRSEIENLLKCQQGACPGVPRCASIVRLLGRSPDGGLVFEKLVTRQYTLYRFSSMAVYKRWIEQLIAALRCLHGLGIVHRDLRLANLLFSADGARLAVCDLEGRWGQRWAPELNVDGGLDAGWTEKSDIYDLGVCIRELIYANVPITGQVEWPVPPPFEEIAQACTRAAPGGRPTLDQLSDMVNRIPS
ncbi:MAG: hypothetical protein M1826_004485 [Phylliscum demangeonii]|nr:MAG: hypothetical protein M1826_004485 [Phylliscum demangeonii]